MIASECLTGKLGFESESLGRPFQPFCMAPLPVPSQLGPVPAGFDAWFAHAVAREKSERFQSIKEAADGLRALCGRTSGRPSAVSYPAERGGSALSSGMAAPIAGTQPLRPEARAGLQTTSVPSSRSIPGLPKPLHSNRTLLIASAAVLVSGGLFASWRWVSPGETTAVGAASVVESSLAAVTAQSMAPIVLPAPESTPALQEKSDAGVIPDNTRKNAIVTPQPVQVTTRHVAPARPATPVASAKPVPRAAAKEPPPADVKAPPNTPKKSDNNAAGI